LLLCAKSLATARALQRLFSPREIDKHYVAWLDGNVATDHGLGTLPLRVDIDDRPRNIVDPVFGKPADTEWRVLARERGAALRDAAFHDDRAFCPHSRCRHRNSICRGAGGM